ncbi:MAG: sensor histidine kinase [Gemmatimonadota bacterium]
MGEGVDAGGTVTTRSRRRRRRGGGAGSVDGSAGATVDGSVDATAAGSAPVKPEPWGWRSLATHGRYVWLIVLGGATAVALLSTAGEYARAALRGDAVGFFDIARYQAIDWYLWALAAPFVFALARRVRPSRVGWPRSAAVHGLACATAAAVHIVLYVLVAQAVAGILTAAELRRALPVVIPARVHIDVLAYLALLGMAYAIDYYALSRERALRASRLETRLAQAQLDALRTQLQPHFLFNALNAVTGLVRRQRNREAVDVLAGLGDLLRDTLDSPDHEVPLAREIELLEHYLAIQRVRFGDRLTVEVDAAPDTLDAAVPGLMLQPLVENAIRHGVERQDEPVRIVVRARRHPDAAAGDAALAGSGPGPGRGRGGTGSGDGDDALLILEVVDDGPGIAPGARDGVGLSNTRARLRQLHGDGQRLEVERGEGGGTTVRVGLPYRRLDPEPGDSPPAEPSPSGHSNVRAQ